MATVVMSQERRDFSRIEFRCPATLNVNSRSTTCHLLDIALRGARIQTTPTFDAAAGDPCVLLVRLDAGSVSIRMIGTVAYNRSGTVGITCRGIDLDSAMHLRRLLEVNLAEDRLLDRELNALLQSRRS
jgi:hypothetical protein